MNKKITTMFILMILMATSIYATMELPIPEPGTKPTKCPTPYWNTRCLYNWINLQDYGQQISNSYVTYKKGGSGMSEDGLSTYLVGNKYLFDTHETAQSYYDDRYVTRTEYEHLRKVLGEWQGQYHALVMQVAELQKKC